uniref:trypsin n=1 Tax=Drosophila rhopaloa TaxID=1041015 RepID=A0A6P4E4R1_DRORH
MFTFIKCFLLLLAFSFLSAGRVPRPEERIIGGNAIAIEEAPWQVSLQLHGHHYCGGSIYSKDIIITAAHCRFTTAGLRLEAEDFLIRVGSSLKDSEGTLVKVAAICSHEDYSFFKKNDIAVMRLSEPLKFTNKVQSIPLAKKNPAPGTIAMVSGWGATLIYPSYDGSYQFLYPINLQGVYNYVQSWNTCIRSHSMTENTFCAGHFGQSACNGDSGGPLVVNQTLVGVVSEGTIYCIDSTVYVSVSDLRAWILNAIESI